MNAHRPFNRFNRTTTFAALLSAALTTFGASAATRYVDDNAPGDPGPFNPLISDPGENGSPAHPYDRIQEAINVAASGDTIVVAPGTYYEFGTVNLGTKNLIITAPGNAPPAPADPTLTVIDMINWNDQVMQITGGQNATTVIEGLTLKNGRASSAAPNDRGAGLYCDSSSPVIRNCVLRDNIALNGGGFYANLGAPKFENCQFINNNSGWEGAGMYLNSTACTLTGCVFTQGFAGIHGGAIHTVSSTVTATLCRFIDNEAATHGGAVSHFPGAAASTYNRCLFQLNIAGDAGGAAFAALGSPEWRNCVFDRNHADGSGGGLSIWDAASVIALNCSFSGNSSSGSGGGGAIYTEPGTTCNARNCIAWGNTPSGFSASTAATHCNVQNAMAGTGNISLAPMFVDAANGDLRIMEGSPCIDRGNSTLVPLTIAGDYDGLSRVVNGLASGSMGVAAFGYFVDMGAFEFQPEPVDPPNTCPADIAPDGGNGVVNIDDLLRVIGAWGACP